MEVGLHPENSGARKKTTVVKVMFVCGKKLCRREANLDKMDTTNIYHTQKEVGSRLKKHVTEILLIVFLKFSFIQIHKNVHLRCYSNSYLPLVMYNILSCLVLIFFLHIFLTLLMKKPLMTFFQGLHEAKYPCI